MPSLQQYRNVSCHLCKAGSERSTRGGGTGTQVRGRCVRRILGRRTAAFHYRRPRLTAQLRVVVGGLYADHGAGKTAHQTIFLGLDTALTASLLALLAGPLTASALQLLAEPGHRCLQRKRRMHKLFLSTSVPHFATNRKTTV